MTIAVLPVLQTLLENVRFEMIPRNRICPLPNQPREYFDPVKLRELAGSIKAAGQIQAIIVTEIKSPDFDFQLLEGQRRWLACEMVGVDLMKALICNVTDEANKFLISFIANFGHEDHTPMEIARGISRIMREKGLTANTIAVMVGKSVGWIDQYKGLLRLHEKLQARMGPKVPEAERLTLSVAIDLSSKSLDLQLELAEEIRERGLKLHQARSHIRGRVNALGLSTGVGNRKPVSDFRLLSGFAQRIGLELHSFLAMQPKQIVKVFAYRDPEDRIRLVREFDRNIRMMKEVRELIAGEKKS